MKPQLILLDADIIIEAHELGIWDEIVKKVDIFIPSIIIQDQAKFFYTKHRNKVKIDLKSQVERGLIKELLTSVDELKQLSEKLNKMVLDIHHGEKEALAFIFCHKNENYCFCTGDKSAIQALAMLDMKEKGISMEKLLKSIGLTKKLKHHFMDKYFNDWLKKGAIRAIQEQGLSKNKY